MLTVWRVWVPKTSTVQWSTVILCVPVYHDTLSTDELANLNMSQVIELVSNIVRILTRFGDKR